MSTEGVLMWVLHGLSVSALSNNKLCDREPAVRQLLSSHGWLGTITGQGQGKHLGLPQQQGPAGSLPAVLSLAISSGKVVPLVNNWWWNSFPKIGVFAFCIHMAFAF